ncbi:MAG: helix-turn-helix domain-containing protein [Chloroflexota bacterium]|nr:helix-turn-helix domain-containing protein [Chloroflexota bacterium]
MTNETQTSDTANFTWEEVEPLYRKYFRRQFPLADEQKIEGMIRRKKRQFGKDPDYDYEYELDQIKSEVEKSNEEWFSEWLRIYLREEFISQSELARRIGAYPSLVSKWVNGVQRPRPEQCRLIAEALGLPLDQVLAEAGHRPADLGTQGEIRREIAALLDQIPEHLLVPLIPMLRGLTAPSVQQSTTRRLQEWLAADDEDDPSGDLVISGRTTRLSTAGNSRRPDGEVS